MIDVFIVYMCSLYWTHDNSTHVYVIGLGLAFKIVQAKLKEFKRQYVDHAARKLRLIVDMTSANCSHQVLALG